MATTRFDYEVVLKIAGRKVSSSNNPDEIHANEVARWHCDKAPVNSATVIFHDPSTGIRRKTEFYSHRA